MDNRPPAPLEVILSRILRTGREIKNITRCKNPTIADTSNLTPPPAVLDIVLPDPPPVYPRLAALGIQSKIAEELSQRYLHAANELRKRTIDNVRKACLNLAKSSHPIGIVDLPQRQRGLCTAYAAFYMRILENWVEETLGRAQSSGERLTSRCPSKQSSYIAEPVKKMRSQFNQDFVPVLEKYFEYNAFPSHADKTYFSQKSSMSYRQIDVWFQNRRSRARKEGKTLKKLSSDAPNICLDLDSLEKSMGNRIIPEVDRAIPVDSDVSECESQSDSDEEDNPAGLPRYPRNLNVVDPFNIKGPPHAYPGMYPPACGYDPFPTKNGIFVFPSPVWMRKPSMSTMKRPVVDIETLVKDFDRMNLRGGAKRRREKKKSQGVRVPAKVKRTCSSGFRHDRFAATLSITTKPLPAPLPSLVRPKRLPRFARLPISVIPSVPATSRRHVFRSPSPHSRPVTLFLPARPMAGAGGRKIAPLPKRAPTGTSIAHRRDSSASSSQSRTPSLQSDLPKSRTCSNSSSSPSSTVATPTSSPVPLREPSFAPSDLFGDESIDDAPSQVKGLQLDFRPVSNIGKHPFVLSCGTLPPVRVQS